MYTCTRQFDKNNQVSLCNCFMFGISQVREVYTLRTQNIDMARSDCERDWPSCEFVLEIYSK